MAFIHQRVIRLLCEQRGQDLIEYALLAGFVALGVGALMPGAIDAMSSISSRLSSTVDFVSTWPQ